MVLQIWSVAVRIVFSAFVQNTSSLSRKMNGNFMLTWPGPLGRPGAAARLSFSRISSSWCVEWEGKAWGPGVWGCGCIPEKKFSCPLLSLGTMGARWFLVILSMRAGRIFRAVRKVVFLSAFRAPVIWSVYSQRICAYIRKQNWKIHLFSRYRIE